MVCEIAKLSLAIVVCVRLCEGCQQLNAPCVVMTIHEYGRVWIGSRCRQLSCVLALCMCTARREKNMV